ncbi:MAG: 16S rRNA (uracil(1498)-N(3))-methyltransferase [Bacteroidia bacterium]|nr:16S rRNA (uracil(1498)-N(3))-methyltransferase [Bacteroidia bacterium]
MHLFYASELNDELEFTLSADESHHAVRVLRLSPGSEIILVNGRGGWYHSIITHPDPKACMVEIIRVSNDIGKPPYHLHIAIAPTKQIDRYEWFLEKATEIGISEITPIICEHSERKDVKTDRQIRIVIAAMKQSLKAFHPAINEPVSFTNFMKAGLGGVKTIAHCQPGNKQWLNELLRSDEPITILIGPEGDFSDQEIATATANGYQPITLGCSRLRTETAGVVACHTISWINRDF